METTQENRERLKKIKFNLKKKKRTCTEQPVKKQPILTAQSHTQTHSGLDPNAAKYCMGEDEAQH